MIARTFTAALLLGLASTAVADETPNIEPGMWQYNNKVTFGPEFPLPDQEQSNEECVTAEEIEQGQAFLDDVDECDITHKNVRRDGMDYAMTCTQPDGSEMTMEASMQFNGDSATGTVNGSMQTPMGEMTMNITMDGRRIGDC
ncbi:MAG: DUF3617 family protein [Pseudomonadota bacterium]|nr:MAG: DUF3617 family protein [Pseudomonadota bacterium]